MERTLNRATIVYDISNMMVLATTQNSAYQLYNEGIVHDYGNEWPLQPNRWYHINGSYGLWVLENEFPNVKGDEVINTCSIKDLEK